MSGQHRGVQSIVSEAMLIAHYVHCYAHQLNLVLRQATSQIDSVRVFFAHLNSFPAFFSHSTKRVSCLDDCVAIRIPRSAQTRWNFESRIVSTVFEHKDDLKECFTRIINACKRTKLVFVMQVASSLGLRTGFYTLSQIFSPSDATCRCSVCPAAKVSNQLNLHSGMHKKFVVSINNAREKIPDIFHNDSCAVNEEPLAKKA